MGCGGSKNLDEAPEIAAIDLGSLDKYTRFEFSFPLYRTRIDFFEGRVKRFVNGKTSVTLNQLRFAFKDDKNWSEL